MKKSLMDNGKARYIMMGGFLGAGKTTAVAALARRLVERRVRVGLISNDQSTGLVDTSLFRSQGFAVEEIAGGCFCCRFPSLLEASTRLSRKMRPDVFLAEPVGSCTDLVATVSYPLRRIYGDRFLIAPLSVLVDPVRAARIFNIVPGRAFSRKVVYIYEKQLEEAEIIVVNKCDSISASLRERLAARLARRFPEAEIVCCSARQGTDLEPWFEKILSRECDPFRAAMELDYETYAQGESRLGWLNCTAAVASRQPFDPDRWLMKLAGSIRDTIRARGSEIAHLKMTLEAADRTGNLSVVSLVGSDEEPDLRESFLDELSEGDLIINLRAELAPDRLQALVVRILEEAGQGSEGLRVRVEHLESFRPGKPEPTHRFSRGERPAEKTAATRS